MTTAWILIIVVFLIWFFYKGWNYLVLLIFVAAMAWSERPKWLRFTKYTRRKP